MSPLADNDDGPGNVSSLRVLSEDDWCGDGRSDVMVIGEVLLVVLWWSRVRAWCGGDQDGMELSMVFVFQR